MSTSTPTKDIVRDIFLIEFDEKKNNTTHLLTEEQVSIWSDYFEDMSYGDIAKIPSLEGPLAITGYELNDNLCSFFETNFPILYEALTLCEGKLSLYGLSFLSHLDRRITFKEPDIINLCFDSCTISQATNYLLQCIKLFPEDINYCIYEQGILIMDEDAHMFFSFNICMNKEQILRNVGSIPDQHTWNPITGYLTTFCGGLGLSMMAYPLNVSYSIADTYRYTLNGYTILFHGLDLDSDERNMLNGDYFKYRPPLAAPIFINPVQELQYFKEDDITMKLLEDNPPTYINFKDWCKQKYICCIIGIDDDRYVALNNIKRKFLLDDDTFRLLCSCLLSEEANLARTRLLLLKPVEYSDSD